MHTLLRPCPVAIGQVEACVSAAVKAHPRCARTALAAVLAAVSPCFAPTYHVEGTTPIPNRFQKKSLKLPAFAAAVEDFEAVHGVGDVCTRLLPFIAASAATFEGVFAGHRPMVPLSESTDPSDPHRTVRLTKGQCLAVLANAFLCLFPRISNDERSIIGFRRPSSSDDDASQGGGAAWETGFMRSGLPSINYDELFSAVSGVERAKVHMQLLYFSEMQRRAEQSVRTDATSLIIHRAVYVPTTSGGQGKAPDAVLGPLTVHPLRTSIDDRQGALRVDFANKMIGGALSFGCVQEEITFAICPELNVARLFNEVMGPREAIVLLGAEQFSIVAPGTYAFSLACGGPVPSHSDAFAQSPHSAILAVDAHDFRYVPGGHQYTLEGMQRELVKFSAGLSTVLNGFAAELAAGAVAAMPALKDAIEAAPHDWTSVATGNWGCGVFGGDAQLKALLQWICCSRHGLTMHYFPFDRKDILALGPIAAQLIEKHVTAAEMLEALQSYGEASATGDNRQTRRGTRAEGLPTAHHAGVFGYIVKHFGLTA